MYEMLITRAMNLSIDQKNRFQLSRMTAQQFYASPFETWISCRVTDLMTKAYSAKNNTILNY